MPSPKRQIDRYIIQHESNEYLIIPMPCQSRICFRRLPPSRRSSFESQKVTDNHVPIQLRKGRVRTVSGDTWAVNCHGTIVTVCFYLCVHEWRVWSKRNRPYINSVDEWASRIIYFLNMSVFDRKCLLSCYFSSCWSIDNYVMCTTSPSHVSVIIKHAIFYSFVSLLLAFYYMLLTVLCLLKERKTRRERKGWKERKGS